MSQTLLTAVSRPTATKGQVRRLRAEGKLPAVIYNRHGQSRPILLDSAEFAKAVTGVSESTILKLSIDGKTTEAFIKDRQVNWLRGTLLHVDFFEVEQDRAIRAHVSVHLLGVPVGVREGGILEAPVHEVEVECLPKDLPGKIELDVSNLGANHSIHVRDISLPNVRILNSGDQVVALVKFAKAEAAPAVEEAAPAEGEAAAAPAAGAAPGAAPAAPEKKE